jgi:hypothetical protein
MPPSILRLASLFLTPTPRTTPDEWGRQRTYKSSSGVPGPRDPGLTGYMIPLGRKAHEGTYSRVVSVTGIPILIDAALSA